MGKIHFYEKTTDSLRLGILLAIVGGYLDAYTYIGRDVFANAQTGNIVLLGIYAAQGRWMQAMLVVPPILAFVLGVLAAESIKTLDARGLIHDWAQGVLFLEIIILVIVGFIPASAPNLLVTVTISFIASVQVSSFRTLIDTPYCSTMCTGNLRTASKCLYMAVTKRDRLEAQRASWLLIIIASFLVGAVAGSFLTERFSEKSVWIAALILLASLGMLALEERKTKRASR